MKTVSTKPYIGKYATEQERHAARHRGYELLEDLPDTADIPWRAIARQAEVQQQLAHLRGSTHAGWHLALTASGPETARFGQAMAEICCSTQALPQPQFTSVAAALLLEGVDDEEALAWLARHNPGHMIDRPVASDRLGQYVDAADGGVLFIHSFGQVAPNRVSDIAEALVYPMEFRRDTLAIIVSIEGDLLRRLAAFNPSFGCRIRAVI
jgi:hypothetical protein